MPRKTRGRYPTLPLYQVVTMNELLNEMLADINNESYLKKLKWRAKWIMYDIKHKPFDERIIWRFFDKLRIYFRKLAYRYYLSDSVYCEYCGRTKHINWIISEYEKRLPIEWEDKELCLECYIKLHTGFKPKIQFNNLFTATDNIVYNTYRSFQSYKKQIEYLKKAGFNPIGVCQIELEDAFIFNTQNEASRAHELFEWKPYKGMFWWRGNKYTKFDNIKIVGYWYSKEEFLEAKRKYEKDTNFKIKVYWL